MAVKVLIVFLLGVFAKLKAETFIGCQNERLVFKCADKFAPDISSSIWGRQAGAACPFPDNADMSCSIDVTDIIREKCNMKKCAFTPNKRGLGEPCEGIDTMIITVEYECRPEPTVTPTEPPAPPPTTTTTTTTTTPAPASDCSACKPGWTSFQGSCYLFVYEQRRKWDEAKLACENLDSHLVTISSTQEFDYVTGTWRDVLETNNQIIDHFWTAGRLDDTETYWIWDDGTEAPFSFDDSLWFFNTPDNLGGIEHHLQIWWTGTWTFNDIWGEYDYKSVCEYEVYERPCKPGWEIFNNQCYRFVYDNLPYEAAKQSCEDENSKLASIRTSLDYDFLTFTIAKKLEDRGDLLIDEKWWTAGKQDDNDNWFWDDGTNDPVSFDDSLWHDTQPDNDRGIQHNMELWNSWGTWGVDDLQETEEIRSVCQYEFTPSCKPNQCRPGWYMFGGSCYLINLYTERTFEAAKAVCEEQNAHLVTVQSEAEFEFVIETIKAKFRDYNIQPTNEKWWTAGKQDQNDQWIWDDGTDEPIVFYDLWYPFQPDNLFWSQHHLSIWHFFGTWGFDDLQHDIESRSICEYEL